MAHTVVQHSGYGYAGDPQFQYAVESRAVNEVQQQQIEILGGVTFGSYAEAEDFAMAANYPPSVQGFTPHVTGWFAEYEVDGLRLYIPSVD